MYYEIGEVYTYQDKIEFNVEAVRYQRKDRYHEQEFLSKILDIISDRKKKLKDVQRKKIQNDEDDNENKYKKGFINNIK
jgi:hypothetical protein